MFDDKKQPVEDMFSGTEHDVAPAKPAAPLLTPPPIAPASAAPQPETPQFETPQRGVSTPAALPTMPRHHAFFGMLKVLCIVIVVLGLVVLAALAAYRVMVRQPADDGIVRSVSDNGIVADDPSTSSGPAAEEIDITAELEGGEEKSENKETFFDSDGDGLTNAEELEAGTLANNPDTDSDGLGDREEVEVYETDPREADTDDDTFLDGQEVAGGYNPNGEGRLFNVPNN